MRPLFLTGSITRWTDLTPTGTIVPGTLARRTSLRAIDRKARGQTLNALHKRDVQMMLDILSLLGTGGARASQSIPKLSEQEANKLRLHAEIENIDVLQTQGRGD